VERLSVDPTHNGLLLVTVGVDGEGFTTAVIAFEVAGDPVTHSAFDVITTVIISPFARVVVV
jgi:hypothetical protein